MANGKKRFRGKSVEGIIDVTKSGVGFLKQENEDDIFISRRHLKSAMKGDKVLVEMSPKSLWSKGPEGFVVSVLKRATTYMTGTYYDSGNFGFVVPMGRDGADIYVKTSHSKGAATGDKVVAKITSYPKGDKGPAGKVTEIIASADDPRGDVKALLREHGIETEFTEAADKRAKLIATKDSDIQISREVKRRRDLRKEHIITIDGPYSKDLDDAVSIRILENGHMLLGVHIADVSHYVKQGDPLDETAFKRGNSIYLLDQVVPMLPPELSNGICSLNPYVDRLTLSCSMEIDKDGVVISHDIFESVINSKGRLVYDDVSELLENFEDESGNKENPAYSHREQLKLMEELANVLRKKRSRQGSLDFDLDESEIQVDEKGVPREITLIERRVANRMIEEFMLIANETVAEEYFWMNYPFVYRIHEKPEVEKILALKAFLAGIGVNMPVSADNVHPKALSEIMERLEGDSRLPMVSQVMLRSMQKARYSIECSGHYGLAFHYYCHFTSPIRRYPDLMIHRIIKKHLTKGLDKKALSGFSESIALVAEHSSITEREAQQMERQIEKLKKAEYMEAFIGDTFQGVISGLAGYGFYVQLENTVEGLVRSSSIDYDTYDFDEGQFKLVGRDSGKEFRLGDTVEIVVAGADKDTGHINFELC